MLKAALAIAAKDLTLVVGRGTGLVQAFLLGLLLVFIFSLSKSVGEVITAQAASAIFWMATAFCQILVFNSLYALEEQNGQKQGLLLAPVQVQSIWLGKGIAGFVLLLAAQLIFVPAVIVFLEQEISGNLLTGLSVLLLANLGMSATGSLLGALSQGAAARESLLSVIIFPLLLPLLLAAISLGSAVFDINQSTNNANWFRLLIAFDAMFLAAGLALFKFVYNAQE